MVAWESYKQLGGGNSPRKKLLMQEALQRRMTQGCSLQY